MNDETVWHREEPVSPCIKVCVVHPQERICTGCLRTLDEIGGWTRMSPEERRAVIDALPDRAARLRLRRGGRASRVSVGKPD